MIDLDTLEAAIAEGEKKNFFVAPIVKTLIAELRHAREENAALAQTSADPCLACGWRFFVPGDGCQGCLVAEERAENERLRGEASYLRACVPPVHPRDYGHEAWAEAMRAAVAEERAAVVAYLRGCSPVADTAWLAGIIERGEHRREEER